MDKPIPDNLIFPNAGVPKVQRRYDMNVRFQMQGRKNWILPKKINANRFFWDSHWLEIWSNHLFPSMGPNGGSVAMGSVKDVFVYIPPVLSCSILRPPAPPAEWELSRPDVEPLETAVRREKIPCTTASAFLVSASSSISSASASLV